jgi:hypothetical protein
MEKKTQDFPAYSPAFHKDDMAANSVSDSQTYSFGKGTHMSRREVFSSATAIALPLAAITATVNPAEALTNDCTVLDSAADGDPTFQLIAKYEATLREVSKSYDELDQAEFKASKAHGRRPWSLIAWRNYSAIGGIEIDRARDEFLEDDGDDRDQIEREYADAKRREQAAERAGEEWDLRTNIAPLRKKFDDARELSNKLEEQLAQMKPTTVAGAAALLECVRNDLLIDQATPDWRLRALETLVSSLLDKTDPIFSAIMQHKAAFKSFVESSDAVYPKDREATQDELSSYEEASIANDKACETLINTMPMTVAGARAALEWLAKYDEGCVPDASDEFLANLRMSPNFAAMFDGLATHA